MAQIRTADAADAAAIASVHVASWQLAYRELLPADYLGSLSVDARASRWVEILRTGTGVLLAQAGEQVVGFVSYGRSRDDDAADAVGEIYALYVQPAAWGTGVGRDLHDAAVAALSALGLVRATLWVLERNARARTFYARQGWRPDGALRTEEWPGVTLTEVRYQRHLGPA